MGITAIVPRGAVDAQQPQAPPSAPMSPQEAHDYMRTMADGFQRERMAMPNYKEPIALGGSKPQMLKPEQGPDRGGAPVVPEPKGAAAPEQSLAMVSPPGGGGSGFAAAATEAAAPLAAAKAGSSFRRHQAAPKPALTDEDRGDADALPLARVARSPKELASLWKALGKGSALPAVDFPNEMIVALDASVGVEIVDVRSADGRVVVAYRVNPDAEKAAVRVVPASSRPVELRRVR